MPETTEFTIGSNVVCTDGPCGEVSRVVIDPISRTVTHLVVEPRNRRGLGRLVTLDLVNVSADEIQLSCTRAEFDKLDSAEETHFLPGTDGIGAYGPEDAYQWPYFAGEFGAGNASEPVTIDTLPPGEVGVCRGENIHATDGDIGTVHGLIMHPGNHEVTHVLTIDGHLWDRKQIAIPIGVVKAVDGGIQLDIDKEQVADLPVVKVAHRST